MSRILIIEDDRAIALGLRLNLRRDGHEVRIAQDGETGLRMALEPDVDLIVLDVMLPDRKSTRLNSSHLVISYAVFCLKKKKKTLRIAFILCDSDRDFVPDTPPLQRLAM